MGGLGVKRPCRVRRPRMPLRRPATGAFPLPILGALPDMAVAGMDEHWPYYATVRTRPIRPRASPARAGSGHEEAHEAVQVAQGL